MKMKSLIALVFVLLALSSCEGFFGDKTDLSFIETPDFQAREVAYVPIQPIIDGFIQPTDVLAGYDELFYVVDAGTEEIIAFDQAGREQGRLRVPGVTKIAQDRRLDILAIGTFDTIINNNPYTLSTIYRLNLNGSSGYGISKAEVENKIINPFYFKTSFSSLDAEVKFTSLDVMASNEFYVTRNGPRQNINQVGGPDDGVLRFDAEDNYKTNVFITTEVGFFRDYFKRPTCIVSYAKPPQTPFINETGDFFIGLADPTVPLKIPSISFLETDFGSSYEVENLGFSDTAEANDFLYRPSRFENPVDMTITGDGTNYLFVVDQAKDSIFQFTTSGFEGVNPPPGSSEKKNIIVSFGGTGIGANQFNSPSAVAYLNRILYITDQNNGRLLRFKLTTDFE